MKLFSNATKSEHEVKARHIMNSVGKVTIIPHSEIARLIGEIQETKNLDIKIEKDVVAYEDKDDFIISYQCVISDAEGRSALAIGEATPATLTNEIARNYPCTMAHMRAFDRAAIKYLGFNARCYSESEGVVGEPCYDEFVDGDVASAADSEDAVIRVTEETEKPEPVKIKQAAVRTSTTEAVPAEINEVAKPEKNADPNPEAAEQPAEKPAEKPTEKPAEQPKVKASAPEDANLGDTMISIGKYKSSPKKLSDIAETDASWFKYMANMSTPGAAIKAQVEIIKRYAKEKGI